MACELDAECRQVYRSSFPDLPANRLIENIRQVTRVDVDDEESGRTAKEIDRLVPDHDVLCGGFPCQPFSKSGAQMGVRDRTRGTLFFDILEILRAKQPRYVMLENVRNLAGPRHKETWATIIRSLRETGYRVSDEPVVLSPHLIPPEHGGAAQVRDRVFILGELVGPKAVSERPNPILHRDYFPDWNPDRWQVSDLLLPDAAIPNVDDYRVRPVERTWLDAWDEFVKMVRRAARLPDLGGCLRRSSEACRWNAGLGKKLQGEERRLLPRASTCDRQVDGHALGLEPSVGARLSEVAPGI